LGDKKRGRGKGGGYFEMINRNPKGKSRDEPIRCPKTRRHPGITTKEGSKRKGAKGERKQVRKSSRTRSPN